MPPSEEESSILALLAEGLTDDVIARRLSISMRTYRRRVQALMLKLGATSRFQAGARAAQRGWLDRSTEQREPFLPPSTRDGSLN